MNILCFSDYHGQKKLLNQLEAFLGKDKIDLAIFAGDFCDYESTNPAPVYDLSNLFSQKGIPLLAITGNADDEIDRVLDSLGINIDNRLVETGGTKITGLSGHYTEQKRTFEVNLQGAILATHWPPRLPSKLLANHPDVHIFGHLHSKPYSQEKFQTLFIHTGPACEGYLTLYNTETRRVTHVNLFE